MSLSSSPHTKRVSARRVIDAAALVAALAAATLGALGCSHRGPEQFDPNIFSWSGALAAPGSVELRSINGAIEVKPSTDDNVRVEASARWHKGNPKTDLHFQVTTEGSKVRVCVLWGKGACTGTNYKTSLSGLFTRNGTDANVTLTVYVPTSVKVDALTVNGSVDVTSTAPVVARTVNGSVRVATAVGPVVGETVNGSVDVRMTSLGDDGPVRAETVNGSASAYLPTTANATVSLAALNGKVGSDFAVTAAAGASERRSIKGAIGTGGRVVKVESVNGSAWLHMLNSDGTVSRPAAGKS